MHSIFIQLSDRTTSLPVKDAQCFVEGLPYAAFSDSSGMAHFRLDCNKGYHIHVRHVAYLEEHKEIEINAKDSVYFIELLPKAEMLEEVLFSAVPFDTLFRSIEPFSSRVAVEEDNLSLESVTSRISGVAIQKNGDHIGSPIVKGLSGNRLSIVQDGVSLSGQRWGSDHSPELNIFSLQSISLAEGVEALAYWGNSLGKMLVLEPKPLPKDSVLKGKGLYALSSNGWGHSLNVSLEKRSKQIAWRLQSGIQRSGGQSTPNYILGNTGRKEITSSLTLGRQWSPRFSSSLSLSLFQAEYGIFSGSNVGNLTDLSQALSQNIPLNSPTAFSYRLSEPRQDVSHRVAQLKTQWKPDERQTVLLQYAFQKNLRKEFDPRRGDRSSIPTLSLDQSQHFLELKHQLDLQRAWNVRQGIQAIRTVNINIPETNILPFIPNYLSQALAAYITVKKTWEQSKLQFGARWDSRIRDVATIATTFPNEVLRFSEQISNSSAAVRYLYKPSGRWSVSADFGYHERNPEVNELYSVGLHQGVGSIEEGNLLLKEERALNTSIALSYTDGSRWQCYASAYLQTIDGYIFLAPTGENRLTIRGAFPVFQYQQTDALLQGIDASAFFQLSRQWQLEGNTSLIRAQQRNDNQSLIGIPPGQVACALHWKSDAKNAAHRFGVELRGRYIFAVPEDIEQVDIVAPPNAYFILESRAFLSYSERRHPLRFSLSVQNMTNTTYRNYLNGLRYFADDIGINVQASVEWNI